MATQSTAGEVERPVRLMKKGKPKRRAPLQQRRYILGALFADFHLFSHWCTKYFCLDDAAAAQEMQMLPAVECSALGAT